MLPRWVIEHTRASRLLSPKSTQPSAFSGLGSASLRPKQAHSQMSHQVGLLLVWAVPGLCACRRGGGARAGCPFGLGPQALAARGEESTSSSPDAPNYPHAGPQQMFYIPQPRCPDLSLCSRGWGLLSFLFKLQRDQRLASSLSIFGPSNTQHTGDKKHLSSLFICTSSLTERAKSEPPLGEPS